MIRLFDADSPLMRFLTRFADLMILNLLFVATSLPVVTLGASLTALNDSAMRIARGDDESTTGDYLRSFRRHLRQGTVLGFVVAGLALVLGAWYVVVGGLDAPVLAVVLLRALCFLAAFRLALVALYAFPYLARFENTTREVLDNARRLSARHPLGSVAVLAVTVLPVVLTAFYPRLTGYGLLWFLLGFAGVAFVNAFTFTSIFSRYIEPAPAGPAQESAGVA